MPSVFWLESKIKTLFGVSAQTSKVAKQRVEVSAHANGTGGPGTNVVEIRMSYLHASVSAGRHWSADQCSRHGRFVGRFVVGLSPRRRRTRTSGLSDDLRACIGPEAGGHVRRLSRAVVDRSVMATLDELCERRQQSCLRCPDRQFRWLGLQLSGRWIRPNAARLEGLPQAEPLGPSSNGWLQSAKRPQGIRVLTLVAFWSRGLL